MGVFALILAGLLTAWLILRRNPAEMRPALQIIWICLTVGGIGGLASYLVYCDRRRKRAWKNAVRLFSPTMPWDPASGPLPVGKGSRACVQSAKDLSPRELELFAAQMYRKSGYQAIHTGRACGDGVDVRLINAAGKIEIVQCEQSSQPVDPGKLQQFLEAMQAANAVHGYYWAPGGFSKDARIRARGLAITLADDEKITRMVVRAYGER